MCILWIMSWMRCTSCVHTPVFGAYIVYVVYAWDVECCFYPSCICYLTMIHTHWAHMVYIHICNMFTCFGTCVISCHFILWLANSVDMTLCGWLYVFVCVVYTRDVEGCLYSSYLCWVAMTVHWSLCNHPPWPFPPTPSQPFIPFNVLTLWYTVVL